MRRRRPIVPLAVAIAAMLTMVPAAGGSLGAAPTGTAAVCPDDAVPDAGFSDTGPPHATAIDCLAWYGIVEGTAPGSFEPREPVLRGQTASMAFRLLTRLDGIDLPSPDTTFTDVRGGSHAEAIARLASFAPPVLRGFEDGTFRPYSSITRGQYASVLMRLLDGLADGSADYERLPDATFGFFDAAPVVHRDAIARLAAAGVISGYPDGMFRADEPISREQVASLLVRSMAGLVEAGLLPIPGVDSGPDPDPGPDPGPDPDPDPDPDPGPDPDPDPGPPPGPDPDLSVELSLTQVAAMDSATAGAAGPDGVLYLAERAGTLHPLLEDGVGDAVLDISDETTTTSERGLLGVAFSEDGAELYLSYTDLDGDTVIDAVAVDDGVIDAEDRRTVFTQEQPFGNHNGGDIHVGPDGMLFLGLGDGGGGGDPLGAGQDLTTALGAMVRIDPQGGDPYAIPVDNPFVGRGNGVVGEIWQYGLRNPWRFSFDRQTGDLWIADVGQSAREEINFIPYGEGAGVNFGWNLMEGTLPFDGGTEPDDHYPPIYEYETGGSEGCAITGGFVYRGDAIQELQGAYLYADYCVGAIRGLHVADGQVREQADLGIAGERVVSFAEDAAGEHYVLELGGDVHRIDPA